MHSLSLTRPRPRPHPRPCPSSPSNLIQHASIDRNHLPINISAPGQEQDRLGHFLVAARPARGHIPLGLNLLVLQLALPCAVVAVARRQLGGEVAGGDGVDADVAALELGAHEFAQVHGRSLGGVVGEVALRVPHESAHAGDDDHGRGPGLVPVLAEGGLE